MERRSQGLGIVAIGRNEGLRLRQCLESAAASSDRIVYVDSGSTDESVGLAEGYGAVVVNLSMEQPFSAARARNVGFERLLREWPDSRYVHFVDGDCEIVTGWIEPAIALLEESVKTAVVCGRRRERHPDQTVFNRLCDIEWDTAIGQADSCGGDSIVRVQAFKEVGGFNPAIVAGEEPDLCYRLRKNGWTIYRVDEDMTIHDANITKLRQWWRRAYRAGHAFAEGQAIHGKLTSGFQAQPVRSILSWSLGIPAAALTLSISFGSFGLLTLLAYPIQWYRIRRGRILQGTKPSHAGLFATFCILGKIPEFLGVARYWRDRALRKQPKIIEYKA